MKNIISKLRNKLGHDKFIHPAARIIVENEKGEVLFIERKDNGQIGLPAGSLEEDETIEECIIREVKKETGIDILELEVVGISSCPENETVTYPNKDVIQYFCIEFYSNKWFGDIKVIDTNEILKAEFKDKTYLKKLPKNEQSTIISLEHFRKTGKVRLN